jgi:hypothetical protein
MAKQTRNTLKQFFSAGKLPSEEHFADLIDSSLNSIDEGFNKTDDFGFEITPQSGSKSKENLISFFRKLTDKHPSWSMSYQTQDEALQFIHTDVVDNTRKTILSMDMDGKLSVSMPEVDENTETPSDPFTDQVRLDVGGAIRAPARAGVALTQDASIPADGKFHRISGKLFGAHALEVVARLECREQGRFAIMHAVALNAYNPRWKILNLWNRAGRIRIHQSYFSGPRDRLKLRWESVPDEDNPGVSVYQLSMKSAFQFPESTRVSYHVTKLWSDEWEQPIIPLQAEPESA